MVNLLFQLLVQKLPGHEQPSRPSIRDVWMMNFLSNEMLRLLLPRLLDCMRLPEIPEDEEALELLQHARLFAAEVSHHIRKIPSVG